MSAFSVHRQKGSAWNLVTKSAFAQSSRTTAETGSRDPLGRVETSVVTSSGKQNSEPEHKAVPLLLDVVLERDLIGSAISPADLACASGA